MDLPQLQGLGNERIVLVPQLLVVVGQSLDHRLEPDDLLPHDIAKPLILGTRDARLSVPTPHRRVPPPPTRARRTQALRILRRGLLRLSTQQEDLVTFLDLSLGLSEVLSKLFDEIRGARGVLRERVDRAAKVVEGGRGGFGVSELSELCT